MEKLCSFLGVVYLLQFYVIDWVLANEHKPLIMYFLQERCLEMFQDQLCIGLGVISRIYFGIRFKRVGWR